LASRTPLVRVEERQWQVQLIERQCKRLGLIPNLRQASLDEFRKDPVRCMHVFVARYAGKTPHTVRSGVEREVVAAILEKYSDR